MQYTNIYWSSGSAKFPLDWKTEPADGNGYLDLKREGKRSQEQLNKLVNSGFEVRDLFINGDVAVLLQRVN